MSNQHVDNERLQLLLDGRLGTNERVTIDLHLQNCSSCRQAFHNLSALDASLKVLPVERASVEITRAVMTKISISPGEPFLYRVVEHLAYVFGMILVLGIMLAAFLVTGVLNKTRLVETHSTAQNVGRILSDQVDGVAGGLTSFMQTYMPFVFGNGNMKIAVMSALAISLLVVFDRVLHRRFHI
jgi:anti-sigma factor RsiW